MKQPNLCCHAKLESKEEEEEEKEKNTMSSFLKMNKNKNNKLNKTKTFDRMQIAQIDGLASKHIRLSVFKLVHVSAGIFQRHNTRIAKFTRDCHKHIGLQKKVCEFF